MKKRRAAIRGDAGFTLIEVVISAAIAVLIGIVVTKFWIGASEGFNLDNNKSVVRRQSERTMEMMADRLRRANAASIALSDGNSTIDFVDTSDGSNVRYSFTPPAPDGPAWGEITQSIDGVQSSLGGYAQNLGFTASPTGLVVIDATFIVGTGRTQAALTVQCSVAARN
jgi:type II secretory pathway pseudopilin PulG